MKKILIVDDDEQVLQFIKILLEANNYQVITLKKGRDIGGVLEKNNIAMVITDLFMPDYDGLELIRFIKKNYPNLTVIAMSDGFRSLNPDSILVMAKVLGATEAFKKPLPKNEFLESVKNNYN